MLFNFLTEIIIIHNDNMCQSSAVLEVHTLNEVSGHDGPGEGGVRAQWVESRN